LLQHLRFCAAKYKELQERCGKRAAEVFAREYSPPVLDTDDEKTLFNYENHHSARLNKCFFLEIAMSYEREEGKPGSKIMRTVRPQRQQGVRNLRERSY
jgi:hypothetical protein